MSLRLSPPEHIAQAMAAVQNRQTTTQIDHTEHLLEDGTTIRTQERVVKEVSRPVNKRSSCIVPGATVFNARGLKCCWSCRG